MISYLFINLIVSFWALGINRWMNIPERHKFPILLLALLSWLFPYNLVSISSNVEIINNTVYTIQSIGSDIEAQKTVQTFTPTLIEVGMILILLGMFLFTFDVIKLIKKHGNLAKQGRLTRFNNVWVVDDLDGACVSGFWQPKIWVNKNLFDQPMQEAVLAHERQHIRNGDVYWLLIIGFVQRLFWFNPWVYGLNKKLREVIELRCDEACQKQLGNNSYQEQLAKILLIYQQTKPTSLLNEIAQNKKFQIKRIQHLSQEKIMKNKNRLQITVSILAILLLSAVALAGQDELQKINLDENEVVVNVDFKVIEEFSGLKESASAKRQIVAQYDEWQEVELDRYFVKYKVSQLQSDESPKLFMIEAQILNTDKNVVHSPSLMVQADTVAAIEVSADTINEPEFNLSFEVLSK